MSFRLFIYYCALCGGWAAFLGWFAGRFLHPSNPLGMDGIRGMWLGMMVALGLSLVDALWNLSLRHVHIIAMRVGVAVLVGLIAGLLGGVVGHVLYDLTKMQPFFVVAWTLTGALVGAAVGVFDVLASVVFQRDMAGSVKKIIKTLIGGTLGGLLGGSVSLALGFVLGMLFQGKEDLWGPTAWGFVALGMSIGLLIGLAQVMLKEAWIKIEKGRRVGREMILARERTTIGRAESCDIGLFGDNQIEKLHASILLAGNRYYVEDQQTPGGTFVNDEPVTARRALKSGDRIRLGSCVLCFRERVKR